jgi:hypothetical protein
LNSRGVVYFRRGEFNPAIFDCDVMLQEDPRMAGSLYVRGVAKLKEHDTSDGDADIATVDAIQPHLAK